MLFPVSEYFTYDSFLRYLERYINSDKYKSETKYLSTDQINIDSLVGKYDKRKNKRKNGKNIKTKKTKGFKSLFGSLKKYLPKKKDKQSKKSHSKLNNYIAENYVYIKNIYRNYNKKTLKDIKDKIKGIIINTNVSKIFKFSATINELFSAFIKEYPCSKGTCYNDKVEITIPTHKGEELNKNKENEINEIKKEIGVTISNIISKIQQNRNAILKN